MNDDYRLNAALTILVLLMGMFFAVGWGCGRMSVGAERETGEVRP